MPDAGVYHAGMKIVCAPDSFKECLSADAVARAMAAGIERVDAGIEVDCCPVADGGEGTMEAVVRARRGRFEAQRVRGPLGDPVGANWGLCPAGLAVIETAAAAGLALVPAGRRDALAASSYGVGELMLAARRGGASRLVVGLGGSATTDGGCGMAQAIGVVFRDRRGRPIADGIAGGALHRIAAIEADGRDPLIADAEITGACDVTNSLTGPDGAARVFAPQKGADAGEVELLASGLAHLAELIRRDLGVDVATLARGGAAGGLGAGLVAFAGARLTDGIALVLDAIAFEERIRDADLCLTGEGRLDGQSLGGKACLGVARLAARHGVPTVAIVGELGPGADAVIAAGFSGCIEIGRGLDRRESIRRAEQLIAGAAADAVTELRR